MWRLLLLALALASADTNTSPEIDGETSRKVLGSSVVTSVSVIMDSGNGSKVFADAAGHAVAKPLVAADLASPIDLLHPDRYEFYTFDDTGDLIKRLMSLAEIRDIIATGDGDGFNVDDFTSSGFMPEKRVNEVVHNVQNVLKEEIKTHKPAVRPQFDTPDVSDTWSMILPAVFGNSGEDIQPDDGPIYHVTPDTIVYEPTLVVASSTPHITTSEKLETSSVPSSSTQATPTSTTQATSSSTLINVQIFANSNSSTEPIPTDKVIEIKPYKEPIIMELTKENARPIFHVNRKSTKKPDLIQATTFRPVRSTTSGNVATVITSARPVISSTTLISTKSESYATPIKIDVQQISTSSTKPSTATLLEQTVALKLQVNTTIPKSTAPSSTTLSISSTTPKIYSTTPKIAITEPMTTVKQRITTNKPLTTIQEQTDTSSITTNTEVPTTLTTSNDDLPSLINILNNFHSQSYSNNGEKLPESTTTIADPTTTYEPFSTFFLINENQKNGTDSTDATLPNLTTSEVPPTNEINDLSTLGTEQVTKKLEKPFKSTTEVLSTTNSNDLDQYLLTSTNIYEINTELGGKLSTTTEEQTLTSLEEKATEKYYIRIKEPATSEASISTTTDQNFVETIEQLLAQAVGTAEPPIDDEKNANKIDEIMKNSYNKTMDELLVQTATSASNLMDNGVTEPTTTEVVSTTTEQEDGFGLLNESVEMLLSQISGQESTTLEPFSTTIVPAGTTTEALIETTTTQETSTLVLNNLQNITVFSKNQTKPAKSDTSLEIEYQEILDELNKNSSLTSFEDFDETSTATRPLDEITEASTTVREEIGTTITTQEPPSEPTTIFNPITSSSTLAPIIRSTTIEPKPSIVITINESTNKTSEEPTTWTLVSTLSPNSPELTSTTSTKAPVPLPQVPDIVAPVDLVPKPLQGFGLEDSTARLDTDIYNFVQLCNELAFGFWKSVTTGISSARSVVASPFAATSLLAMVFLGARGATSGEMNEILKLDDMVTFNPHLIFKNVSESIESSPETGVAASAIIRELYSDRSKGKLLNFYKDRVRQFYDGHVEEASFREIGDVIRRRTNLLVKKETNGKISEFLRDSSIFPKPPLAGVSVSIFQTDCSHGSTEGRDGELYFVVLPSIRQRRLIPIPATVFRSGFLAGYEPSLDATAAALGTKDQTISTIFIIPGQQGMAAPGDGLARLEKRLVESSFKKGAWSRLLRSLIPRPGIELQIPRFQHRSLINSTQSLKKMGLHELFDSHKADLKGLNGAAHELHLSEVLQVNEFATCGEGKLGEEHHKEVYPATAERKSRLLLGDLEEPRDYQRAFHDPLHDPSYLSLPLPLRPRQARLPDAPRLRFDRPFLYVVRHNPSGLILHMGRFHPRLLP